MQDDIDNLKIVIKCLNQKISIQTKSAHIEEDGAEECIFNPLAALREKYRQKIRVVGSGEHLLLGLQRNSQELSNFGDVTAYKFAFECLTRKFCNPKDSSRIRLKLHKGI